MAEAQKLIKVVKTDNPLMFDHWTMHQWEKLGKNKNGWEIANDEVNTPPEVLEIKSKNALKEESVKAEPLTTTDEVIGVSEVKKPTKKK